MNIVFDYLKFCPHLELVFFPEKRTKLQAEKIIIKSGSFSDKKDPTCKLEKSEMEKKVEFPIQTLVWVAFNCSVKKKTKTT